MTCTEGRVTVLVEDTAEGAGLAAEHGLSLWLETPDMTVLFDTGQGGALPGNAEGLGVDLSEAQAIVLSHGHYDHTGGLAHALARAPMASLFLHPDAISRRYSCREDRCRAIGIPTPARVALAVRHPPTTWMSAPVELARGIHVTGPIPRGNAFEDTGGPFFIDTDGHTPDPIADDQALWIETVGGLIVLLGCAHSGVVNTLEYIGVLSGGKPIRAVIGGMHLGGADESRLARTVDALRRMEIAELWPCHCTGGGAIAALTAVFGARCHLCGVGTRVGFPAV